MPGKHMKLPNGFGRITKLNKKLRNPYRVMVTVGHDENGKPIGKILKPQGYFRTYNEAYQALMEYNRKPYDLSKRMTIEELYDEWSEKYFATLKSASSRRTIESAWKYSQELKDLRVVEFRARHLKSLLENDISPNMKTRVKSLFNLMMDYAVEYELVDKNYARDFNLSREIVEEKESIRKEHVAFTGEELATLLKNQENITVQIVLLQCFMGWRPQEVCELRTENIDLENRTVVGGMKTAAGTNRTVPIHPTAMKILQKIYDVKSERLFPDMTYDKYAKRFAKIRDELNLNPNHRPHDGRKTFVTLCKKYNVDEYAIKKMVGHVVTDITEALYTDRDPDWLRTEISKIPVY